MDLIEKSKSIIHNQLFSRKYYLNQLDMLITTKNMLVITGQRRVGKSYIILDYLQTKKVDLATVFYLNKELDTDKTISTAIDLQQLFEAYTQKYQVEYLIIDEIQDIAHWEDFIREQLAYKKYKIIITGSNSKLLS
ncbi:MAG: AAA family ATPase [Candidatus Peribacteria bacterium]|jgi:predicted AAA+ superfamily ATPase|nr:AAA family ATPase [Candidatus Peribacteria bacterium]